MSQSETTSRAPAPLLREIMRYAVAAALLGALFGLVPLGLGSAQAAQASHLRLGDNSYGRTQQVEIGLNKSLIVDLPGAAREVIVSQPAIAGAIMRTKRRAIIQGMAPGDTNIFFLDGAGETIAVLEVSVTGDSSVLVNAIARLIPGSSIQVQNFGERLVLSGHAQSQDDVDKAIAIAGQFASGEEAITSIINVSGSQQVMLKVTVAEVNKEIAKQYGINLSASVDVNGLTTSLLSSRGSDGGSVVAAGGPGQLRVQGNIGSVTIDASLRALASRGAVRMLAEPTLTALSGQEADFHVGGEFPIQIIDPVTQERTLEFKDFGVLLSFTPTVRSNGMIGLKVNTEVSEIVSAEGQLNTRQAGTTVELPKGTTLAIGGLLQDRLRQQINRMPILGDIPILGTLFRSRDFIHSRTELVILVTPYLAYAGNPPELPTDRYVPAGDAEAIFLGRMEAIYGVGPGGMRGSYDGSVGFVLD